MNATFFINHDGSRAYKLEGRDLVRLDFRRIKLADSIQTDCRLQESKATSEDVMRIRREFIETNEDAYNQVLANVVAYASVKLSGAGNIVSGTLQIETA